MEKQTEVVNYFKSKVNVYFKIVIIFFVVVVSFISFNTQTTA